MNKKNVVYIYSGILLSHKKHEILPFPTTWIDLESILLNKMSDRERQILYDITYMWNLKNDTNEIIYKAETDSQT